jgi:hypothetical protein
MSKDCSLNASIQKVTDTLFIIERIKTEIVENGLESTGEKILLELEKLKQFRDGMNQIPVGTDFHHVWMDYALWEREAGTYADMFVDFVSEIDDVSGNGAWLEANLVKVNQSLEKFLKKVCRIKK